MGQKRRSPRPAGPPSGRTVPPAAPAGYSGTPLARKLGFGPGATVHAAAMPAAVRAAIEADAPGIRWTARAAAGVAAAHVFVTRRSDLERRLAELRRLLDPAGMVWISWPKKSAGVATDITEDTIREVALPIGLVDVKVCAVDATWSGLKLMIRKELR